MLNPASLPGLRPQTVIDPKGPDSNPAPQSAGRFEPGSAVARALFSVWSGNPVTVLSAPPGSGKTRVVVDIVMELSERAGLSVLVACPTRAQVSSLAQRLNLRDPYDPQDKTRGWTPIPNLDRVSLSTLSRAVFQKTEADVLIVDEAYQATFSQVATAASGVGQILLVGDPGQIGPVVTSNTSAFAGAAAAPHLRAPEVFSTFEGAVCESLDSTYRLGPASARVVAPLYPFAFESKRPQRSLVIAAQEAEVASFDIGTPGECDDPALMAAVADRVRALLTGSLDMGEGPRPVVQSDIAVVVSRNSQVAVITGLLRRDGLRRVEVGTADRLQGGEWPLVVSLDPLCGNTDRADHATSLGRLCVMASRHQVHLSWLHPTNWRELLAGSPEEEASVKVRERIVDPTHD